MTYSVTSTCTALTPCTSQRPEMAASTTLTHSAQAKCSDGIAPTWLAWPTSGEPHDPQVWPWRTVSVNPASRNRGGAVGYSRKQATPPRLTRTNEVRAHRYTAGRRTYSQASRANALRT